MTNHWIDIKNADVVLIIGSNAAEHHPVSFKWIMRAKDNGAALIHVDPKFSRTSARCDYHVPLRSGTDIAFLGGMVNYILESNSYFHDYVVNYTNASFIVGKGYDFKDGLFSGYDAKARKYDQSKWGFEKGPDGAPLRDASLKHERCVFNLMKKHYSRYTLKNVSDITGVSEENLLKVYKQFCATGKPDKAGTILYALGWTQHTVGVQNIRASAIIQLLLGNIGVAGGGINALRGEPNVQGSTDHALLYHVLPGYIGLPLAPWQTLAQFNKANTPVTKIPNSANWWGNRPKYFASLLKGWYGEEAKPENDFCYGLLPKGEPGADYSYMYVMDKMYQGKIKGGFVFGVNPMNSFPNTNKMRKALDNLDWMVCAELHNSETTDNWHRPGVDPKKMKTEVFLLPSAHRVEKAGTISNSGRWLLWFDKAVEPAGEARNFADMFVPLINKLRELYKAEGGKLPEALLKKNWPESTTPKNGPAASTASSGPIPRSATACTRRAIWSRHSAICRPTAPPRPSTGCTPAAIRRMKATSPSGATRPRRPCRPPSACIPTGRGAGRSTGASCTTALPWTSTASPTIPRRPSSNGTARSGWATCRTAPGPRRPIPRTASWPTS